MMPRTIAPAASSAVMVPPSANASGLRKASIRPISLAVAVGHRPAVTFSVSIEWPKR